MQLVTNKEAKPASADGAKIKRHATYPRLDDKMLNELFVEFTESEGGLTFSQYCNLYDSNKKEKINPAKVLTMGIKELFAFYQVNKPKASPAVNTPESSKTPKPAKK